jgi:hypothetical protein
MRKLSVLLCIPLAGLGFWASYALAEHSGASDRARGEGAGVIAGTFGEITDLEGSAEFDFRAQNFNPTERIAHGKMVVTFLSPFQGVFEADVTCLHVTSSPLFGVLPGRQAEIEGKLTRKPANAGRFDALVQRAQSLHIWAFDNASERDPNDLATFDRFFVEASEEQADRFCDATSRIAEELVREGDIVIEDR